MTLVAASLELYTGSEWLGVRGGIWGREVFG